MKRHQDEFPLIDVFLEDFVSFSDSNVQRFSQVRSHELENYCSYYSSMLLNSIEHEEQIKFHWIDYYLKSLALFEDENEGHVNDQLKNSLLVLLLLS